MKELCRAIFRCALSLSRPRALIFSRGLRAINRGMKLYGAVASGIIRLSALMPLVGVFVGVERVCTAAGMGK